MPSPTLVLTSIASDTHPILRQLARETQAAGWRMIVMGDTKSPATFSLPGCEFFSIDNQLAWSQRNALSYAQACPTRHYARKNIGYLEAIRAGATTIVETDDDNIPLARESPFAFWAPRRLAHTARLITPAPATDCQWVNVYRYFASASESAEPPIWPRGLALPWIQRDVPALPSTPSSAIEAPIQQGLADDNPDVDAIYRLVRALPYTFARREPVALGTGAWCPFNSQNTTWFAQAFALLYLPALCSFRMTDIWRSFVAQRICWAHGWPILFHEATVRQERNDHNLQRDFDDEISGYSQNHRIVQTLARLTLNPDPKAITDNLRVCYTALVDATFLPPEEIPLLDAWLHDLARVQHAQG